MGDGDLRYAVKVPKKWTQRLFRTYQCTVPSLRRAYVVVTISRMQTTTLNIITTVATCDLDFGFAPWWTTMHALVTSTWLLKKGNHTTDIRQLAKKITCSHPNRILPQLSPLSSLWCPPEETLFLYHTLETPPKNSSIQTWQFSTLDVTRTALRIHNDCWTIGTKVSPHPHLEVSLDEKRSWRRWAPSPPSTRAHPRSPPRRQTSPESHRSWEQSIPTTTLSDVGSHHNSTCDHDECRIL